MGRLEWERESAGAFAALHGLLPQLVSRCCSSRIKALGEAGEGGACSPHMSISTAPLVQSGHRRQALSEVGMHWKCLHWGPGPAPGATPGLRCRLHPQRPILGLSAPSHLQNIRVWDMQDYECLQSFCGKLFALGHRPITSAYFHKDDNSLVCSTCSVSVRWRVATTAGACSPWDTEGGPIMPLLRLL